VNGTEAIGARVRSLRGRWWWIAAVVALIAVGLWVRTRVRPEEPAAGVPPAGAAARAIPVVAVPAQTGDIPVVLNAIGTVTPRANVTVRSRVDGQLVSVRYREGQEVHAGDLLAEIDPRPFQVQLEQAQGQLARDEAQLANARVDLARYRKLVAQDSIPKQQLDTQESLVRQYEAALGVDRAAVDQAKLQLDYARITAPVDGRLGLRLVDVGNMVHATDTGGLVTITQTAPIDVVFTIPEDSLPPVLDKVRAGGELTVEAYDREGDRLLATGRLLTLDNAIDPTTGTVRLKGEFPNRDEALFPNQFVNVRLVVDVRRGVTIVPSTAVHAGADGPFAYVVGPNATAETRPVEVGVKEGGETEIASGLAPGDAVVVDGGDALRDGAKVAVRSPADRKASGGAGGGPAAGAPRAP